MKVSLIVRATTFVVLATFFHAFARSQPHEYLETRFTLPLLFKARASLGRATTLDPKLKVFAFDDTTFAKLGTPDLPMETWAKILLSLADRLPAAVYIDKIFSLPPEPSASDAAALKTLASLEAKIVTTAFVAAQPIKFRTPLALEAPAYRLETYFETPIVMMTEGFLPMPTARGQTPYAADKRLAGIFRYAGHSMNAGFGKAAALLDVAPGRVLPHMALMGADKLSIEKRELYARDASGKKHEVPLDAEGRMFVDFGEPAHYFKSSKRMLGLIENALAGRPQLEVNEGDTVLLLPAMYTGHTDFTITPIGPLPGPYVVASLVNSLIRRDWVAPFSQDWALPILAVALGTVSVGWFGAFTWLGAFGILVLWLLAGGASFIYLRVLVDVSGPALAFLGTTLVCSAQRSGVREKLVRIMKLLKTENEKLQTEIDQAGQIASAFRPYPPPRWGGLTIGAFHRSLSSASGDWYAFEASPSGAFRHFLMCDISGHGVQAAIVVSTCKTVLSIMARDQREAMESPDFLLNFVRSLNATLYKHGRGGHVTTLAGVTFQDGTDEVRFLCCGHPQPLAVRYGEKPTVERLNSFHNPVGIKPEIKLELSSTKLGAGEHLLVYTDGLHLPRSGRKMDKKLLELARSTPPEDAVQRLSRMDWDDGAKGPLPEPDDDISLVWFARQRSAVKKAS